MEKMEKKNFTPQPKLLPNPIFFKDMSIDKRFDPQSSQGRLFAPLSWGNGAMTVAVHYDTFKKSDAEITTLAAHKKEQNKKFFKLFGTKRPTAGVVRRHYLTVNLD